MGLKLGQTEKFKSISRFAAVRYYLELKNICFFLSQQLSNIAVEMSTEHRYFTGVSGNTQYRGCLLYTSPSPRDATLSRMPSSA